ncbi:MAG: disulfide bond formation protein B [Alphaproteobacteria bacterium]
MRTGPQGDHNSSQRTVDGPGWWIALFAAWLIALVATLAALFIGEVMGQAPCLLCWHQRIAMFPLAVVLGVACLVEDAGVWRYGAPLAAAGLGLAAWHNLLYFGIVPQAIEPCGAGPSCSSAAMTILGGVPIPTLSLIAFVLVLFLLLFVKRKARA